MIGIFKNQTEVKLSDFYFFPFGFSQIGNSFVGSFISCGRHQFLS